MLAMNGFGGAPVPSYIVVVCWSIPVAGSFIGPSFHFIRAALSCGVVKASCLQTFLLLSVRHGLLTLYLLSMQTLRASWGFLLIPNLPIGGPLVLTLRPFLTCHIWLHHYPSLLGFSLSGHFTFGRILSPALLLVQPYSIAGCINYT